MITIHNLILSYLAENEAHKVSDVRGVRLSYANGKTSPQTGKPMYDNLPLEGTRKEQIEFLHKSHVNSLEYFARSKDETTKQSAQTDLLLVHKQYAPFITVNPYKGVLVEQDKTPTGKTATVADLAALLASGKMTLEQFTVALQAMNSEPETKGYDVTAKIKKAPKQNTPVIDDEKPLPQVTAKAIKFGFSIKFAEHKQHGLGVLNFGETFTCTLRDENGKFLNTGTWEITTIRKDKKEFSVKRYIA